jgi:hypothetical protein
MKLLRDEQILINKKDFTCQLGEWLVEILYDGKRAESGIQKGWDVLAHGKHIQVKTHSKAEGNNNRWSAVERDSSERIDELIIIVFTQDYKLKEFYKIPWEIARYEINWNSISDYNIAIDQLPKQEIVGFLS